MEAITYLMLPHINGPDHMLSWFKRLCGELLDPATWGVRGVADLPLEALGVRNMPKDGRG